MDPVLSFLSNRDGFVDPMRVTYYSVVVRHRQVEIELYDLGEAKGCGRYMAQAKYAQVNDGEELVMNTHGLSLGNPDGTIEDALDNVHWQVFTSEG